MIMTGNCTEYHFSETALRHLKLQQGLSERYQHRTFDVALACKLTHVYGKYHLAMLHRQLAMSEERTTCISPSMPMHCCGRCARRWGHKKSAYCILIRKRIAKDKFLP